MVNHNFCLFRKLNVLRTSPWAPFLTSCTYASCEWCQTRSWSNTTLRFITQFVMKATLRWSKLGPWLSELPHLGFHLERHVILPNYRNVNIFVDVTLGWLPLGASVTFLSLINNCVINYFHDHKSPFVLCLCVFSTRGTISGVCFFSPYVFSSSVFSFHFTCSPFELFFPWSPFRV